LGSLAHSNDPDVKLGAFNRIEYANADVDRLLQSGATMMDEDERRATYEEAMEKTMADKVYISLVQLQTVWAAKAGIPEFAPRFDEDTLAFFITPAS
jgi:peptide/nickel transport system substrate-binding protein